jgi:hypothetical protein
MGNPPSTTAHIPNLLLIEDSDDDVALTKRVLERAHIGTTSRSPETVRRGSTSCAPPPSRTTGVTA